MKTILYARASVADPDVIRDQMEQLKTYAYGAGFNNCEEVIDDGYPSDDIYDSDERPGLSRVIDEMTLDKIGTIIVTDLSRVARKMIDISEFMDEMDSNGVRFIALIDQIDNMPHKYEGIEDSDGRYAYMMSIINEARFRRRQSMDRTMWGRIHWNYIEKHRPKFCEHLEKSGNLSAYIEVINATADYRFRLLLRKLQKEAGLLNAPEHGKQGEWMLRMEEVYQQAVQTIRKELIEI